MRPTLSRILMATASAVVLAACSGSDATGDASATTTAVAAAEESSPVSDQVTTTTTLPTSELLADQPRCDAPPGSSEQLAFAANDGLFLAVVPVDGPDVALCQLSNDPLGGSVAWTKDGRVLAWLEGGMWPEEDRLPALRLWDSATGSEIPVDRPELEAPTSIAAAPEGLLVMAGNRVWHLTVTAPGEIEISDMGFKLETKDPRYDFEDNFAAVVGALANGRPLVRRSVTWGTGYNDSIVTLGDNGEESDFFYVGGRTSASTSFDYDSNLLAIDWGGQCGMGCAAWGYLELRDLRTGERVLEDAVPPVPETDSFVIEAATFGADGRLLVAGHVLRCGQDFQACPEASAREREEPSELWLAPEWERIEGGEGSHWAQASSTGRIAAIVEPDETWAREGDLVLLNEDGNSLVVANYVRSAAWAP